MAGLSPEEREDRGWERGVAQMRESLSSMPPRQRAKVLSTFVTPAKPSRLADERYVCALSFVLTYLMVTDPLGIDHALPMSLVVVVLGYAFGSFLKRRRALRR